MPTRRARMKRRLLSAPYSPIAAYLGFIAWVALPEGVEPPSMREVLPHWLVVMWTISIALGGTFAVIGLLMGRLRVEAAGLTSLAYGAVLWGVVLTVSEHRWDLATPALTLAIGLMCGIRMYVLSLAIKAEKEAQRIATSRPEE